MADDVDKGSAAMLGSAAKCRPIGAYAHTPTYDDLVAEIARLRLTDAERKALEYVEFMLRCESHPVCRQHTDTLRGLLKRMGWWSHGTQDQRLRREDEP